MTKMRVHRVGGVLAAIAAALGLASQAHSQAMDKLTVRLDWAPHGMHAPIHLAIEKGWFKRANLDVQVEDGNGSVVTTQLVGSGNFDVGHANLSSVAMGKSKGIPVISIAGFVRKSDMGVLVPAGSGWKTIKDFEGKKVAYTAGSLEGPFIDAFFGASKSKVDLLNVDAATKIGTYLQGTADAVISTVPYVIPLAAGKRPSDGVLFADFGLDLPGFGMFTSTAKLNEKGPAIKRFNSVVAGAWGYVFAGHQDESVAAIIKNRPQAPLDPKVLRGQIDGYQAYFYTAATKDKPIGIQADEDWVSTIKAMEAADVIKKGSKPGDYYTNNYIDHAIFAQVSK